MDRKTKIATVCALLGCSIFGFSFMFSRIALGVASPFVMLTYRFLFAFIGLTVLAIWSAVTGRGRGENAGDIDFMRFDLRGRKLMPLVLLGLVQPVIYFFCESYGISMTNATFSGVIISLVPIAGLIFGALFLREMPTRVQVRYSLLSIAGVVLMTVQQSAEGEIRPLGVILLFGAVLSGVSFNIISRGISDRFSALERTHVMMTVAAVIFAALALFENRHNPAALLAPMKNGAFLGAVGYLSLVSSIGAFMLLNYANNYLSVAKTTAFCNLTTMISMFAGVVFLGEPFSAACLAASVMIILGVWGVQKQQ